MDEAQLVQTEMVAVRGHVMQPFTGQRRNFNIVRLPLIGMTLELCFQCQFMVKKYVVFPPN